MSNEIEDLKEQIQELEQQNDELQCELDDHSNELSNREQEGYDRAMLEMENKIQSAHGAGFDSGFNEVTDAGKLKSFLNYQMEQRL